jgi:hypothetical protein
MESESKIDIQILRTSYAEQTLMPDFRVARQPVEVRALGLDLVPACGGKNADSNSLAAIGVEMGRHSVRRRCGLTLTLAFR